MSEHDERPCDVDFGYPGAAVHEPHEWEADVQDRAGAPWRSETFRCPGVPAPEPADQTRADVVLSEDRWADERYSSLVGYLRHSLPAGQAVADLDALLATRDAEHAAEVEALELGHTAQVGHARTHYLRAEAAEATVARVRALVEIAEAREAASLSRTFDGGSFGAWIDAPSLRAALDGER